MTTRRDRFPSTVLKRIFARAAAQTAPVSVVHAQLADRQLDLLVGLQWYTILGSDLPAQARRKARSMRARYWVHGGGRDESVGLVYLPRTTGLQLQRSLRRETHSAAQIIATRHSGGTYAWVQMLPDTRYWVAVVRNGQVLSGADLVVDTRAQAQAVVDRIRARFGTELSIMGSAAKLLGTDSAPAVDLKQIQADFDQLAQGANPRSLVQKRARPTASSRGVLLLLSASALGLLILGARHAAKPTVPAAVPPSRVDANVVEQLWHEALAKAVSSYVIPSYHGLRQLWQSIGQLPVDAQGWRIKSVHCIDLGSPWQCEASYQRAHPLASSSALLRGGWSSEQVRWTQLDEAVVTFVVEVDRTTIELAALQEDVSGFIPDADALQVLRPLLANVRIHMPRAFDVQPPLNPYDATPLPRPDAVPQLQTREISLYGPFRFVAMLGPQLTRRIHWRELIVNFDNVVQPSIHASALMATLKGKSVELDS